MRIGTWNLDARWSADHARALRGAACDVWLLTEIAEAVALDGYTLHRCAARMSRGQHYAGVLTTLPLEPLPDPHPATAAARIGGRGFYSSVLPWADPDDPAVWGEGDQGDRTRRAVESLRAALVAGESVWGGDFNHALDGPTQWSGSRAGRREITRFVQCLDMTVPTASLPHRLPGIRSIDHIGVPSAWTVIDAQRLDLPTLSDHDAYVVDAQCATR